MVSALVPGSSGPGSSPGRGILFCVLGQDTSCLPSPRSINGYRQIVGENLTNCWGVTCDGLASCPGGVEILLAASCYGNQDKLWPDELRFLWNEVTRSISTPPWMGCQSITGLPPAFNSPVPIYTPGYNVPQTARSGDECTNHEATVLPTLDNLRHHNYEKIKLGLIRFCQL